MNILVVCDDNLRDSVVYDVHVLSEALSVHGHRVSIIGSARGKCSCFRWLQSPMRRVYPDSSAIFYQFPYIRFPGLNWLFGIFTSGSLIKRLVKLHAFDVIIMYSVLFTGVPTLRIAKAHKIPTTFRNIDMLHQLFANPLKRWLVRYLERYVYQRTDHLFALTKEYRSYLIAQGASADNISILPFPVNTDFFREVGNISDIRDYWGIYKHDFVAVYMGYLYPFSMAGEVIRAIPMLLKQIPSFKLVVVGSGPLLSELEKIRAELALEAHVVLTGQQPFDQMPKYLRVANVCINAYAVDGAMTNLFSAKIIQYMASGKPVLSIKQRGLINSLQSGEHGVIFVSSIEEMVDCLVNLAADPGLCRILADKNEQFVQRVHDVNQIFMSLENTLMGLCPASEMT